MMKVCPESEHHCVSFYATQHDSGGVLWFHIGHPCVHPFVLSFLDDNLIKHNRYS